MVQPERFQTVILGSGQGGKLLAWHLAKMADLFVRIVNVFDKHYATAGFLTSNSFNPNGSDVDPQNGSFGEAGPGRWITIYANAEHTYMVVAGLRFDTAGDEFGTGPRWHPTTAAAAPGRYIVRHPVGY